MNRQDVARIGFVLLGTWIVVEMLAELPRLWGFADVSGLGLAWGASLALGAALGLGLVVGAGALARRAAPAGAGAPATSEAPAADLPDVQAAALAVLGALLVAQALPVVLATVIQALRHGSDELGFGGALTGRSLIEQLLRTAAGAALFLGARPIARAWSRLQDPRLRAPEERRA